MLKYKTQADKDSLYNTPPCYGIYICGKVFKWLKKQGVEAVRIEKLPESKHIFTHKEWHMTGYTLEVTGDGPADLIWANDGELGERAVPSAFARYYDEAKRRLGEME